LKVVTGVDGAIAVEIEEGFIVECVVERVAPLGGLMISFS
jgi:hypothetical protein